MHWPTNAETAWSVRAKRRRERTAQGRGDGDEGAGRRARADGTWASQCAVRAAKAWRRGQSVSPLARPRTAPANGARERRPRTAPANGERRTANGEPRTANGERPKTTANGRRRKAKSERRKVRANGEGQRRDQDGRRGNGRWRRQSRGQREPPPSATKLRSDAKGSTLEGHAVAPRLLGRVEASVGDGNELFGAGRTAARYGGDASAERDLDAVALMLDHLGRDGLA
jgi:hypothetical protein